MKSKFRKFFITLFCVLLLISPFIIMTASIVNYQTYMLENTNKYIVLDKYVGTTHHKYSSSNHYNIIAENRFGKFDIEMNHYDYSNLKLGDNLVLEDPLTANELLFNALSKSTRNNIIKELPWAYKVYNSHVLVEISYAFLYLISIILAIIGVIRIFVNPCEQ